MNSHIEQISGRSPAAPTDRLVAVVRLLETFSVDPATEDLIVTNPAQAHQLLRAFNLNAKFTPSQLENGRERLEAWVSPKMLAAAQLVGLSCDELWRRVRAGYRTLLDPAKQLAILSLAESAAPSDQPLAGGRLPKVTNIGTAVTRLRQGGAR